MFAGGKGVVLPVKLKLQGIVWIKIESFVEHLMVIIMKKLLT